MFLQNRHSRHHTALDPADAAALDVIAAEEVERYLSHRDDHVATPLHTLPAMAAELGVGALHVKDEGFRLGLCSFKALGGAYAVVRLVMEGASRELGRPVGFDDLDSPDVRRVAAGMTLACATDGNHGRSVAQGAHLAGARAVIFLHTGVTAGREAAIARFGAKTIRVDGTYDDSVAEAARASAENGWTVVSDTSWPGYERIPRLVMQGYTALVQEMLRQLPEPPTHVFVQAGVGGLAAAVAGHLALVLGHRRPTLVVVEPSRAACLYATASAGHPVTIAHGQPTVMAMLECYAPSPVAWEILSRVADAFMTVEDDDAVAVMRRLAHPTGQDPVIVAGESGGAGLAGLVRAAREPDIASALGIDTSSRVLVINTEGATDPVRYTDLVGLSPDEVRETGRANGPSGTTVDE